MGGILEASNYDDEIPGGLMSRAAVNVVKSSDGRLTRELTENVRRLAGNLVGG
jgi:hypothetical protein